MPRRLLLLATLAVTLLGGVAQHQSAAAFTSRTVNRASVAAAPDWTPPTVTVTAPGPVVSGTVTVEATASDARSGLAGVVIEYAAGGSWTTLCTRSAAPYSCGWDTTSVPDGAYQLRARATDRAGYTATSPLVGTTVANGGVTLSDPGALVRGSVALTATVLGGGRPAVRLEYRLTEPAGAWTTICSAPAATTLTCPWNTTSLSADLYDVRAVAVLAGNSYTDQVSEILVDNVAPTVALADPGNPLSGVRNFTITAADDESGIGAVTVDYAATAAGPWTTLCTLTAAPYTCRVDTAALADGSWSFRATANDLAGNTKTSTVLTRTVNNTVASVSVDNPGAYLSGTVTLTANAASTNGVAAVTLQRAPAGGAFVNLCTDTAAPYTCGWDTTTVTDGLYDLRAVMTDGKGGTLTSAAVTGLRVDNAPLRALDVQAANRGMTVARLETGDQLTLTYDGQVKPGSILAGWTGTAQPVTVRLRDGRLLGLGGTDDTLDVLTPTGGAVNLGAVNLRQNYAANKRTVSFTGGTIAFTSTIVNGLPRSTITLTLGSAPVTSLVTATAAAAMVWTPSAGATTDTGRACSSAPATESGPSDRDF